MTPLAQRIDQIRTLLRSLEREVAQLPTDTRDRRVGARRIRQAIGDQLSELTWWQPEPETPTPTPTPTRGEPPP